MTFGLYTLLEAGLLIVNAIAILNDQRFLAKCNFKLLNIFLLINNLCLISSKMESKQCPDIWRSKFCSITDSDTYKVRPNGYEMYRLIMYKN